MDDKLIEILTQATGDVTLARMVNGLHRLAVTAAEQAEQLATIGSAMQRMSPAPAVPPDGPPEMEMPA